MTLAELHQKTLSIIGRFYNDHDYLPNIFFATDAKDNLHIMPAPEYVNKREFYRAVLSAYFVVHHVTAYSFGSEAWMAKTLIKEGEPSPFTTSATGEILTAKENLPSEREDRIECLISGAVDQQAVLHSCNRIVRKPGQRPTIGRSIFSDDDKKGPPVTERAGLYGLLDIALKVRAPDIEVITRVIDAVPMQAYFPGYVIMKPAEHDKTRN